MTWSSYSAWSRDTLVRHPQACCTVRHLWRDYRAYCAAWGFEPAEAAPFVQWLRGEENLEIREGGRGRLRRMALGVVPGAWVNDGAPYGPVAAG